MRVDTNRGPIEPQAHQWTRTAYGVLIDGLARSRRTWNSPDQTGPCQWKMPMTLDLPAGAALVNSASFIRDMMDYGYQNAKCLWAPEVVKAA